MRLTDKQSSRDFRRPAEPAETGMSVGLVGAGGVVPTYRGRNSVTLAPVVPERVGTTGTDHAWTTSFPPTTWAASQSSPPGVIVWSLALRGPPSICRKPLVRQSCTAD